MNTFDEENKDLLIELFGVRLSWLLNQDQN